MKTRCFGLVTLGMGLAASPAHAQLVQVGIGETITLTEGNGVTFKGTFYEYGPTLDIIVGNIGDLELSSPSGSLDLMGTTIRVIDLLRGPDTPNVRVLTPPLVLENTVLDMEGCVLSGSLTIAGSSAISFSNIESGLIELSSNFFEVIPGLEFCADAIGTGTLTLEPGAVMTLNGDLYISRFEAMPGSFIIGDGSLSHHATSTLGATFNGPKIGLTTCEKFGTEGDISLQGDGFIGGIDASGSFGLSMIRNANLTIQDMVIRFVSVIDSSLTLIGDNTSMFRGGIVSSDVLLNGPATMNSTSIAGSVLIAEDPQFQGIELRISEGSQVLVKDGRLTDTLMELESGVEVSSLRVETEAELLGTTILEPLSFVSAAGRVRNTEFTVHNFATLNIDVLSASINLQPLELTPGTPIEITQRGGSLVLSVEQLDGTFSMIDLVEFVGDPVLDADFDQFAPKATLTVTLIEDVSVCAGDCDASGTVDFNDLVAMLFEFGGSTPACDADESGSVDFNDLVAALFLFGPCP